MVIIFEPLGLKYSFFVIGVSDIEAHKLPHGFAFSISGQNHSAGPGRTRDREAAGRPVLKVSDRITSGASALGFSARVIRVLYCFTMSNRTFFANDPPAGGGGYCAVGGWEFNTM